MINDDHNKQQQDYRALLKTLLTQRKSLNLATLNAEQQPEASLVPFVYHQQSFWIFVSQLSSHTDNLFKRPYASVLIHEGEENSSNPFVIKRLSAQCCVYAIKENNETVMQEMKEKLGETVALLQTLTDFTLFQLEPMTGRLIAGFGQAFEVEFVGLSVKPIEPS